MARDLVIRIVGDSRSLERSLKKSERSVTSFSSTVSSRMKLVGVAAGAALGTSVVAGLRSSIKAATEAQAVLGQTQVAVKNAGQTWNAFGGQINRSTQALSKLAAVDDEELLKSFSTLVRTTHDSTEALKLNALAADVARGRNIDLQSAALLVAKVAAGNTSILRRYGIQIDKNATSMEALEILHKRFAGSAKAFGDSAAGAQERFNIALENMQEAIGTALLPTLTRYLNKASDWLNDSDNQKRVTDDVRLAVEKLGRTLEVAANSWDKLTEAGRKFQKRFQQLPGGNPPAGGGIPFFTEKDFQKGGRFYRPDDLRFGGGGGGGNFPTTTTGTGYSLLPGPGRHPGLPARVSGSAQIGMPPERRAEISNRIFDSQIARMLGGVQDAGGLRAQIARLRQIAALVQERQNATKDITRRLTLGDTLADINRQIRGDQDQLDTAAKEARKEKREKAIRNIVDSLAFNIDKAGLTEALQDDLSAWKRYEAGIKRLIASHGSTLEWQRDLLNAEKAIADFQGQIADQRKTAGAAAEQSKLDWAQLAVDRTQLTDTLADDLKARQRVLGIVNDQIKAHGKTLELEQKKLAVMLDIKGIRKEQADQAAEAAQAGKDATAKALAATDQADTNTRKLFRRLSATAFLTQFGEGLTRAQKRRLSLGLAMMGPGGTIPAGRSGQFTAGLTIHAVHMHGVQDVPSLENQLAKRAKARPHIRRGARG